VQYALHAVICTSRASYITSCYRHLLRRLLYMQAHGQRRHHALRLRLRPLPSRRRLRRPMEPAEDARLPPLYHIILRDII
jgi:hypothetical protein